VLLMKVAANRPVRLAAHHHRSSQPGSAWCRRVGWRGRIEL